MTRNIRYIRKCLKKAFCVSYIKCENIVLFLWFDSSGLLKKKDVKNSVEVPEVFKHVRRKIEGLLLKFDNPTITHYSF